MATTVNPALRNQPLRGAGLILVSIVAIAVLATVFKLDVRDLWVAVAVVLLGTAVGLAISYHQITAVVLVTISTVLAALLASIIHLDVVDPRVAAVIGILGITIGLASTRTIRHRFHK